MEAFAPKRLEDFEEKLEFLDEPPICAYQEISRFEQTVASPRSKLIEYTAN